MAMKIGYLAQKTLMYHGFFYLDRYVIQKKCLNLQTNYV